MFREHLRLIVSPRAQVPSFFRVEPQQCLAARAVVKTQEGRNTWTPLAVKIRRRRGGRTQGCVAGNYDNS